MVCFSSSSAGVSEDTCTQIMYQEFVPTTVDTLPWSLLGDLFASFSSSELDMLCSDMHNRCKTRATLQRPPPQVLYTPVFRLTKDLIIHTTKDHMQQVHEHAHYINAQVMEGGILHWRNVRFALEKSEICTGEM